MECADLPAHSTQVRSFENGSRSGRNHRRSLPEAADGEIIPQQVSPPDLAGKPTQSSLQRRQTTMRIQDWFTTHTHYWGVPHRVEGEGRLIHECYECGKQRESILGMGPASEPPDGSKPF